MRIALLSDVEEIGRVMRQSIASIGLDFYDATQVQSAVRYIAVPDRPLISDGTYFVVELEGAMVACGGWSRRRKLFTGEGDTADGVEWLDPQTEAAKVRAMFVHPRAARRGIGRAILARCEHDARAAGFQRVEMMATLPGVPLYLSCGYQIAEPASIHLPDGVDLGAARMQKTLS